MRRDEILKLQLGYTCWLVANGPDGEGPALPVEGLVDEIEHGGGKPAIVTLNIDENGKRVEVTDENLIHKSLSEAARYYDWKWQTIREECEKKIEECEERRRQMNAMVRPVFNSLVSRVLNQTLLALYEEQGVASNYVSSVEDRLASAREADDLLHYLRRAQDPEFEGT